MALVRGILHFLKKFVKFVRSRLVFIWSAIPKFISSLQYLLQGFVILFGRAGTLEWSIQLDKEQFNQTIVATFQLIEGKNVSEFFNSDQSFWQTQSSQVHSVDFTKETFLYKRLDHLTETGQKDDVQHFRHRLSEIYAKMWEKNVLHKVYLFIISHVKHTSGFCNSYCKFHDQLQSIIRQNSRQFCLMIDCNWSWNLQ